MGAAVLRLALMTAVVCIFGATMISANAVERKAKSAKEVATSKCAEELAGSDSSFGLVSDSDTSDKYLQAVMETYSLTDLVDSNPSKNLAVQHPFIAMSAAQRLYSIIMGEGTKVENIRRKGKVTIYNLFSEASEVSNGKAIVGQEPEIDSVVDSLREAIRGSVKVPFLVGPHGTGKTLFQDIFRAALWNKTLNEPDHYYFTFEWHGLDDIEGTAGIFPGGKYKAPLHDSPITLLPRGTQAKMGTQEKVIQFASKNHKKLTELVGDFSPVTDPDPHSFKIKEKILDYYTNKKGSPLTEKEIIESLSKHVTIRREVLGSNGTAPVMDSQGRDYSQGELFISKDPLNSNIVEGRLSNPWAWNFGLVPNANGSVLFLDEFPRNEKSLRDIFLRIFESHEVSLSGQTIPIDAFMIAAGNLESLENMSEGGDAKAQADRLAPINFIWSIVPQEIAKTLLYMYGDVEAKPIGNQKAKREKANIQKLFPRTPEGGQVLGTDGRYELWLGSGDNAVHVNPHTLMLIANITAATRIHIKGAEALQKEANFTANTSVYQHPVERIKYLNGTLDIGETSPKELDEFSVLMHEGHFGLSARDAAEWLREAANEARRQEGELTPAIALNVFHDMVNGKRKKIELFSTLFKDKEQTRKMWHLYANLMAEQILLPSLRNDIFSSIAHNDELVTSTFDQVIREIVAAGAGKSEYNPPNGGAPKVINIERLSEISEIYVELHKNNLDINQLSTMYITMLDKENAGQGGQRDSNLMEAIQAYYARKETSRSADLTSLSQYSQSKTGSANVGADYSNLLKFMQENLGYSEVGMRQSLALVEVLEARIAQAKRNQQ